MNIIMYGTKICPDCVEALEWLEKHPEIHCTYKDFGEVTANLKEFLQYRDTSSLFDEVKAEGKIGIPLIVLEDGTLTFTFDDLYK